MMWVRDENTGPLVPPKVFPRITRLRSGLLSLPPAAGMPFGAANEPGAGFGLALIATAVVLFLSFTRPESQALALSPVLSVMLRMPSVQLPSQPALACAGGA